MLAIIILSLSCMGLGLGAALAILENDFLLGASCVLGVVLLIVLYAVMFL